MERVLFANAPVQNGEFTLTANPGKAVGIRIATALNDILGQDPVPHLWNTVTLTGDLRYRQHANAGGTLSRADFDAALIAAKYNGMPQKQIATDADQPAADLAVQMVEAGLRSGRMRISRDTMPVCAACGHMTGTGARACKACGSAKTRERTVTLLVADRDPTVPALPVQRVHAFFGGTQRHLRGIADNAPTRLILSRDRDHGVSLDPVGLPGLVLDPRAGLHATALASGLAGHADIVAMPITASAAANIAAHGQLFSDWEGTWLRYALHGRVPYLRLVAMSDAYSALGLDPQTRRQFETWFLPLLSLKETNGVVPGQLPALLKHFHRARLAADAEPGTEAIGLLRTQIRAGDSTWVTRKAPLAAAMWVASRDHLR